MSLCPTLTSTAGGRNLATDMIFQPSGRHVVPVFIKPRQKYVYQWKYFTLHNKIIQLEYNVITSKYITKYYTKHRKCQFNQFGLSPAPLILFSLLICQVSLEPYRINKNGHPPRFFLDHFPSCTNLMKVDCKSLM